MSTEGSGKACMTIGAPLIAGIGAGVLVGDGIMWCGEELRKKLDAFPKKYAEHVKAMQLSARSQVRDLEPYLSTQLNALAIAEAYQDVIPGRRQGPEEQAKLQKAITQAQQVLAGSHTQAVSPQELERRKLQLLLKKEIIAGRSILPVPLIQEATTALEGPDGQLSQMLVRLQETRRQLEMRLSEQELQQRQVEDLVALARRQLASLGQVLRELNPEQRARFVEQQKAVQQLLAAAQTLEADQLEEALAQASSAQQGAESLYKSVSTAFLTARLEFNGRINEQAAALQTLRETLDDVRRGQHFASRALHELTEQVEQAYSETQSLQEAPLLAAQQRLMVLAERSRTLKQDVLVLVETFQQRLIAETISKTLAEQGFYAPPGSQNVIHENGDMLRVVVSPPDQATADQRDDRLVTFDISRSGEVNYNFIGYVGDSCLADAESIFAALRARGLYILEPRLAEQVQDALTRGQIVTPQTLQRSDLQLHPVKNKTQARLAEHLLLVLSKMQYQNVTRQVVGGCVEIEAFNGELGYRMILRPEGSLQLFKEDGEEETDALADASDPLTLQVQEFSRQAKLTEQKAASDRAQRSLFRSTQRGLQEH